MSALPRTFLKRVVFDETDRLRDNSKNSATDCPIAFSRRSHYYMAMNYVNAPHFLAACLEFGK